MKKKQWLSLIAGVVIIVLAWKWSCYASGGSEAYHKYPIGKYYRFEDVREEGIVQEFNPKYNYLESVELFPVFGDNKENGMIHISIKDEEGKEIFEKKYAASRIETGEFHEFKVGKKLKAGESYRLCISQDGNLESLQVMVSEKEKNLEETGMMMIQGEQSNYYNVVISYRYKWKSFWGFNY